MNHSAFQLKGLSFEAIHTVDGLIELDRLFLAFLKSGDRLLHDQLVGYREGKAFDALETSHFILACAPWLEAFVAESFGIEEAVRQLQLETLQLDPLFRFKTFFVLREGRRALKKVEGVSFTDLDQWVSDQLIDNAIVSKDRELAIASLGDQWLENAEACKDKIDRLILWCAAALKMPEGQKAVKGWVSFWLPERLNYESLVTTVSVANDSVGRIEGPNPLQRLRDGFELTDSRMSLREAMGQVHYCVYCHETDGDFCSKGFPVKKGDPQQGLKINPLGETLTGCPIDEKISEMHALKKQGYAIAALATVMIDNPMCPVTGHRICNDCMKGCIYQKQEPVNIPQTETRILSDVLDLPWGVEIYDLLTRWNPLRQEQYLPKSYAGKKVLVMGMGPAGFTLAHYLLMEGFAVVGAEGLKIEPLPMDLIQTPIRDYAELQEKLDDRLMSGFGGVAEYGITVRWDKNFLKLIYLSLMRRPLFQVFGSIRFGGTLKVEDAWTLGFDHLSIAVGAGLPRELMIPHSLAPGMRQANDFLMALQLTGAEKYSSLANLQVQLPAVVIGGGLTGIDTATEVQAYYIRQVEKMRTRYDQLISHFGESHIRDHFDEYSLRVLDEFLEHGRLVLAERQRASAAKEVPNFTDLIRQWGGVTVAYRRTMQESPAYQRNHEEVIKALEEGIFYAEGLEPAAARLDEFGHISSLVCRARIMDEEGKWMLTDEEKVLAARSVFVATGAKPNIAYEYEHRGTFLRDADNYQRFEWNKEKNEINGILTITSEEGHCKMPHFGPFTSYDQQDAKRVTFLGDTHPIFHGSVVKAIASAKRTYPHIVAALFDDPTDRPLGDLQEYQAFRDQMATLFMAKVLSIRRHSPKMVECRVRAPIATRNFAPGQFYRLQNYERFSDLVGDTRLQTEAMAMIGVREAKDPDVLSFMILERGVSSRLVATFKPGEPISIMGPTGSANHLFKGNKKNILIIGGSMAAAHLRSLGPLLRGKGHRVYYIALMETAEELFCQEELEAASDAILWLTRSGAKVIPNRSQDRAVHGELIMTLRDDALGVNTNDQPNWISLPSIDHVYVIGSSHLLRRIQKARHEILKEYWNPAVEFTAAVYGPMQCMMKGVCAQCLQWQHDPKTGKRTKAVYACSWQHQPMDIIDIDNIDERLIQNRTQEILSNLWLDYLFETESIARV